MLYLERQGADGSRYRLDGGVQVLGRSPEAQISIQDPSLSRRHAEVRFDGTSAWIRDLGSHNGTRVNGVRIASEVRLSPGNVVLCGDVSLILVEEREAIRLPTSFGGGGPDPSQTMTLKSPVPGAPAEQRLATLLRVSSLLAEPGSVQSVRERILELAMEILPIDRAVLAELTDEGGFAIAAAKTRGPSSAKPFSESIARFVLEHRVAAKFDDAMADERLGAAASLVAQSIRCAMCVPLMVEDEVLGVLYVDNRLSTHLFESGDLALLTGFANQAAIATKNAVLQDELRAAALRQNNLERFFPPSAVSRLVEGGGDLGVREIFVTALFSDISGFTKMSSTMQPAEVVALLHAYFPPIARIVFDRDGLLEKYIGDALLAVWGAPFGADDDADRALEAAVEMHRAVERMRADLPVPIDIHIGLHSGVVALANIGSDEYLQVATIGDATNTSARVCGVAQDGEIVISRATRDALRRPCPWPLTPLPPTPVKGKAEPLELYRVEWRG